MSNTQIFFSTKSYLPLAKRIAAKCHSRIGDIESKSFSDGERYLRIQTQVRGCDAVLVGGTTDDTATLDLFDTACGLVSEGCRSLKIIVPFFGYSTMERAVRSGEVVTAKTRARILSAIPAAPYGNEVLMLDLHSEGIPFYFEGSVKTRHLYAKSLITAEAKRVGGKSFVLGAPDAGRAKWVESLANDLGVPAAFVYKRRATDGTVSLSGVNLPIKDTDVVIYDDMIRTGGSILQAAQAYRDAGAKRISLITTHGLFNGDAITKLKSSGLIASVSATDSHPLAEEVAKKDPNLTILSTADLFASALAKGEAFTEGAEHAHR